jgi:putative ABC transport system permease protein
VYRFNPNSWGYFAVKFSSPDFQSLGDVKNKIATIESTWEANFENEPFDYFFLDDYFNAQYSEDEQVSKIVTSFTMLALLLACMGLFSLASYTARQRTKEIGIRKVHGASVLNILTLLSRQYVQLTLIAWTIAIPVSNFFATEWLQNFAFKANISWWLLGVLPGILVLLVALLSVTGQTWKAAQTNPVESLRNE